MKWIYSLSHQLMTYRLPFIVLLAVGLQFCTPKAKPSVSNNVYQEDLSIYRAEYKANIESTDTANASEKAVEEVAKPDVIPVNDIRSELESVNSMLRNSRKDIEYLDGFNIQLYSGNDRDKANEIKRKAMELLGDAVPMVSYEQPNYKVKVGPYYSRIEANVHFNILKKTYVRAVLVPTKIKIEGN